MTDREEFEKVIDSIKLNDEMKKIIDELKANNFAMSAMVCKHPDKRIIDENYDTIKDYCDVLEAENPDVPCQACNGKKKIIMGRNMSDTGWCYDDCPECNGKGTVSTVKALQYENEQLKENKNRCPSCECIVDEYGRGHHSAADCIFMKLEGKK